MFYSVFSSPVGDLLVSGTNGRIGQLSFLATRNLDDEISSTWVRDDSRFSNASRQLEEYFSGRRKQFDLQIDVEPRGASFSAAVWNELRNIPYGETASYRDIAERIGRPHACRAVGQANHRNPVAIVIPCHRVIGSDGSLTGFGGGLSTKEYLLNMEKEFSGLPTQYDECALNGTS